MKKFCFLIFIFNVFFSSCSKNPEEKLNIEIKKYIQDNANDPSSYEPLETFYIDTLKARELSLRILPEYETDLEEAEDKLRQAERELKRTTDVLETGKFPEHRETYESLHESAKVILAGSLSNRDFYSKYVEQIKNFSNNDSLLYYRAIHRCRLKNRYGALTIQNYFIVTDAKLNILDIEADESKSLSFIRKTFINTAVQLE